MEELERFVQYNTFSVHMNKLLVHSFVQMYNEYKNIVIIHIAIRYSFFSTEKKNQKKKTFAIRLRRLVKFFVFEMKSWEERGERGTYIRGFLPS